MSSHTGTFRPWITTAQTGSVWRMLSYCSENFTKKGILQAAILLSLILESIQPMWSKDLWIVSFLCNHLNDIMMFWSEFDWYCFSSWCMYSDCKQIKQKHWTPFIVLDFGLKCCGCSFLPNMYMEGWVQIYSPLFSPCSLQMHKYTDLLLQWHQLKVKVQSKFKQNFYFICISSSVILTCLAVKSSKMLGFFLMSNIFIN